MKALAWYASVVYFIDIGFAFLAVLSAARQTPSHEIGVVIIFVAIPIIIGILLLTPIPILARLVITKPKVDNSMRVAAWFAMVICSILCSIGIFLTFFYSLSFRPSVTLTLGAIIAIILNLPIIVLAGLVIRRPK